MSLAWKPIQKSKGITKIERYLAQLGEKTFLSLWSYPNLFIPKGIGQSGGTGKELCDLLVVFGSNILIFSDKDIKFPESGDILLDWKRWFKKSVVKSARQIYGAERWIKNYPSEIYLDQNCRERFPLEIEDVENAKFFRIAVTKNSYRRAAEYFSKGSSGSFFIQPGIFGEQHYKHPFTVGNIDPSKGFVHVFDERTLDLIFQELDTVYDFVRYLQAKEFALLDNELHSAAGEEDLLAYYLASYESQQEPSLNLPELEFEDKAPLYIGIGEGLWEHYSQSFEYLQTKEYLKPSYLWDSLIENFSQPILEGTVGLWRDENIATHEKAVRVLAAEGRHARFHLSVSFADKIRNAFAYRRTSRICISPTYPDTIFVLVLIPRNIGEDYETYREARVAYLRMYGIVCKYRHPKARYIAVIGMEPKQSLSEDIMVFDIPKLSEENRRLAKEISKREKILSDVELLRPGRSINQQKNPKIGRNEPCLCGSGLKYKKCCMKVK